MAQRIVVSIAGKEYPYVVDSPELEQRMRKAAEYVNGKLEVMAAKYPDKSLEDRLTNIAFNAAVTLQVAQDRMASLGDEVEKLTELTGRYLDDIEGK